MRSKLGTHSQRYTKSAVDWSRLTSMVKTVDDTQILRDVNGEVGIFRMYVPSLDIYANPYFAAQWVLSSLGGAPATHVQISNEINQTFSDNFLEHVAFTQYFAYWIHRYRPDLRIIGYGFSWGNPQQEVVQYLMDHNWGNPYGLDIIDLGLNEYWGPLGFGKWDALRHRLVHEWTGGNHPTIYITECGRDAVYTTARGWMQQGLTAAQYAAELIAYDLELQQDPYVAGAFPFTFGPYPPFDADGFDLDPVAPYIMEYLNALKENKLSEYVLGFKELADQLGRDVVGEPVMNAKTIPLDETSLTLQVTTEGLMVYAPGVGIGHFIQKYKPK